MRRLLVLLAALAIIAAVGCEESKLPENESVTEPTTVVYELPQQITENDIVSSGAGISYYKRGWGTQLHTVEDYIMPFEVNDYDDAYMAVASFADILGGEGVLSTLRPDSEVRDLSGEKTRYRFYQYYNDVPVYNTEVELDVYNSDKQKIILDVPWDFVSASEIDTTPKIAESELAELIREKYGCEIMTDPELVIKNGVLAWYIMLENVAPEMVILDANSGKELYADYPADWLGGA